jgi:hypothetical protein
MQGCMAVLEGAAADSEVLTHARNAGPGKKSSSCEGVKPKLVKVAVSSASMPRGIMGKLMPCSAIQSSSASHLQHTQSQNDLGSQM